MSRSENCENLLIDFNITSVGNEPSSDMDQIKMTNETVSDKSSKKQSVNEILCSSQPLYKLLAESNDAMGDNNPFDHFDTQAGLLDDPFEIVENAALISSSADMMATNTELTEVKTATLISFDSTMSDTSKTMLTLNDSQSTVGSINEVKLNDSVQNTSQKQMSAKKNISQKSSPSGGGSSSTRSKAKNTPVPLLKAVLSNSHLDLIGTDNNVSATSDDTLQKKQKIEIRRDSGTDDSFDDIWSTVPNLIDSQTEIDVESDIDNDIAKLNIPMLKISVPSSDCEESIAADPVESIETKALNRSNILEKYASLKQKIPLSPAPIGLTAVATSSPLLFPTTPAIPIHNKTVDIHNGNQTCENIDTQYSPIEPVQQQLQQQQQQHSNMTNNPDSLIENLQKLVDQCDDKSKQLAAMHLLNDLSSILTKTNANDKNNGSNTDDTAREPPKIKRQGTFNIDRESCSYLSNKSAAGNETICSNESGVLKNETQVIESEFSQVVKQIQNAFGSHQNINVLQSNDQPIALSGEMASVNPTVIVVMAPPPPPLAPQTPAAAAIDYGEESGFSRFQRSRSQSLTLKERPLAAIRASQQKMEPPRVQLIAQTTPIKSTIGQRRRSFSTITQPAINNEIQAAVKAPVNQQPIAKPEAPKFLRRRSLHGPIEKTAEPTMVQSNLQNAITRRRSYQAPSAETGIRLPSPKKNFNLGRTSNNAPLRQSAHTMGTLARRKSFNIGETIKDSPLKIKTSYGIMKKPAAPSASRNLKIRVTQSTTGRSTAPLRAVAPIKQVAPHHLINETVAPVDVQKMSTLITSTPRSIPSPIKFKKDASTLPLESPIQIEKTAYLSTPPNTGVQQPTISNVLQRRRSISDYRSQVNSSVTVSSDSNSGGKISSLKNATKSLATGLSRFTARRMSSIGLKRPSSSGSKENKQP